MWGAVGSYREPPPPAQPHLELHDTVRATPAPPATANERHIAPARRFIPTTLPCRRRGLPDGALSVRGLIGSVELGGAANRPSNIHHSLGILSVLNIWSERKAWRPIAYVVGSTVLVQLLKLSISMVFSRAARGCGGRRGPVEGGGSVMKLSALRWPRRVALSERVS